MIKTMRGVARFGARLLAIVCGCLLMIVSGWVNAAAAQGLTLYSYNPFGISQAGQLFNQFNYASGGIWPYTFVITAGALPAGVTFQSVPAGQASGIATTAGAYSYTVTVTDSSPVPQSQSNTVSGEIAALTPLTLTIYGPDQMKVGENYSQYASASGGTVATGFEPYTYSLTAGAVPAGTTFSRWSGRVDGFPTTAGAFRYTITATDGATPPQTASQIVTGTIEAHIPLVLTSTPAQYTQVGQPYSQTNVGSGGTVGSYYYTLQSGSLPAGITVDWYTGLVSGVPTAAGAFSYTIGVNVYGTSYGVAQTVSGTIAAPAPPLTLALTVPTKMQVGQPYAQANTARGGTPAYTFTLPNGALPAGTTLDPATGMVSGTPTAVGPFSYTVAVIDSAGAPQSASQTISGSIVPGIPALSLASTPSPTLQADQSYWQVNVASGGTPVYRYSVTAGRLPAGTTLDASNGFVAGTATTSGAFSYAITATDSGTPAQTAMQSISGTINAVATTTALSVSHNPAMVGQSVLLTTAVTPSRRRRARSATPTAPRAAGIASPTFSSEQYIAEGWVRVDGRKVEEPQFRVTSEQRVELDPQSSLQSPEPATLLVQPSPTTHTPCPTSA